MLSDSIKELEKDLEFKNLECKNLRLEVMDLRAKLENYKKLSECIIPIKIYTHKARRHTTVKFMDGSQQTVTRIKGEKDCIDTAIAYCILKQLMPKKDLKKLIEGKEEH